MKDWLSLCWFVRLTKGSVGTKIGGKVEGVEGLFRVLVVVSDNPGYIEDVEAVLAVFELLDGFAATGVVITDVVVVVRVGVWIGRNWLLVKVDIVDTG